jgi:hypothetical protein
MTKRVLAAVLCTVLLTAVAGPAAAEVTPRLGGVSYAAVAGQGDVVLGRANGPVRVSARLPQRLACSRVVTVTSASLPAGALTVDPLLGVPVEVVIEPGSCRGNWRDRWANFVVSGATGSDILDVSFVALDGRPLMYERIAVQTSTGGPHR